jgi:hypothetical protein
MIGDGDSDIEQVLGLLPGLDGGEPSDAAVGAALDAIPLALGGAS